jgi:hypothetical protein
MASYGSAGVGGAGAAPSSGVDVGGYQSGLPPRSPSPAARARSTPSSAASAISDGDLTPRGGGDDAAARAAVLEQGIDRGMFITSLKRSRDRIRHCRSVPFSVLMYALFIVDIVLHGGVPAAYDVEQSLRDSLGAGGVYPFPDGITKPGDWYGYMLNSFLPTALPDADADGVPYPGWARGRMGGYSPNLIVGGVRLSTFRLPPTGCALPDDLAVLYGGGCHNPPLVGDGSYDLTPYGNATAAADAGVGDAFVPTTVPGDPRGAQFQFFLDPREPTDPNLVGYVGGLRDAGWLDNATSAVSVLFAVINGETGTAGRARITATFTRGGRVDASMDVSSVALDPYRGGLGGLVVLDLLLVGYWVYLLVGTVRRVGRVLCGRPGPGAPPRGAGCAAWTGYRMGRAFLSYWRLLDIATTLSLVIMIGYWSAFLQQLTVVKAAAVEAASGAAIPSALEQDLLNAATMFSYAKLAGVATLSCLTLRLFKYFAYQPRLAVISDSIALGMGDALHFAVLLGVLVVFYATWGHFMFGAASSRWADGWGSYFSVGMFFMYDYDYDAMAAAYPGAARAFYLSFMFMMTNLMLWMFLAILFESYTEVRADSHRKAPSAFKELALVVGGGGLDFGRACARTGAGGCAALRCRGCGGCGCGRRRRASGTGGASSGEGDSLHRGLVGAAATPAAGGGSVGSVGFSGPVDVRAARAAPPPSVSLLGDALMAVRRGSLRGNDRITVSSLAGALSVPETVAARLLLEVAAGGSFGSTGDDAGTPTGGAGERSRAGSAASGI